MRVAHERRRTRTPDALRVEELISPEILDTGIADREYLTRVLREPRKYLPPPRGRVRDENEPSREPESRGAKLAKLTGLTMAGTLLVGAVVASSLVSRGRDGVAAPAGPPPQITGAAALGGFVSGGAAGAGHGDEAVGHAEASTPPASQAPVAQTQPTAPDTPSSASGTAPATTTAEPADADKLAVVDEFYRRVASAPEQALDLLSPALAGEEAGDLVRAWSTMREVEVLDTQVQPGGSVRAVVLMHRDDGTRLRVTQQLGLDESAHSISDAILLAAEEL